MAALGLQRWLSRLKHRTRRGADGLSPDPERRLKRWCYRPVLEQLEDRVAVGSLLVRPIVPDGYWVFDSIDKPALNQIEPAAQKSAAAAPAPETVSVAAPPSSGATSAPPANLPASPGQANESAPFTVDASADLGRTPLDISAFVALDNIFPAAPASAGGGGAALPDGSSAGAAGGGGGAGGSNGGGTGASGGGTSGGMSPALSDSSAGAPLSSFSPGGAGPGGLTQSARPSPAPATISAATPVVSKLQPAPATISKAPPVVSSVQPAPGSSAPVAPPGVGIVPVSANPAPTDIVLPPSPPVLHVAQAFGPAGQGRLFVQGSLTNIAALGTQVQLDFYAAVGQDFHPAVTAPPANNWGTYLGSKTITQTKPGAIDFSVNLKADVAPGMWVGATVHGRSNAPVWSNGIVLTAGADPLGKGVPAALEALAPHGGDGNQDGIPDNQQADVVSVPTTNGEFITLESPGHRFQDVQVFDPPATGIVLPLGLIGFKLLDVAPGGSATVTMILPQDVTLNSYYKEDPATGALTPFNYDGTTGAEITGHQVILHFVDGQRGDADNKADGVITDPSGGGAGTITMPISEGFGVGKWSQFQTGGSGAGVGAVTYNNPSSFTLTEGNSFQVALKHDFTIPTSPNILTFYYSNLSFDPAGAGQINDAFEAAFVDPTGKSLVPTIAPGRDAFFNITRGLAPALASGVTLQNGTVDLDISKLFVNTNGTLIFRLVNNDHDSTSTVKIAAFAPPLVTVALLNDTAPTGPGSDPYRSDLLTTDPTITGIVSAGATALQAKIDTSTTWTDIFSTINNGQYTWYPGNLSYGLHTITVQATNGAGTTSASLTFTVDQPPVANAGGNQSPTEGSLATFDDSASTSSDGNLFSYQWTLPDGSTQTSSKPGSVQYLFAQDGTYNVKLTVTDIAGATATDTSVVTVQDAVAAIVPIPDQTINETGTASFQTTFKDPGTLDTHTATINWGDGTSSTGTVVEANGAGTVSGSHVYAEEGSDGGMDHAMLSLTDNGGAVATANFIVRVNDLPPTLTISGPSTVNAAQPYTLTLSQSVTPDPVQSWNINWGDGTSTTANGDDTMAVHVYNTLSKFTIVVTGTTDDGTVSANQLVVTINNIPPTIAITGPSTTNEGALYTLNLIGITNSGNPILSWTINWGDNASQTYSGNPSTVTHTYADGPQTYTISATASDAVTTYTASSKTITVNNVGPTVTPLTNQTEVKNAAFTLQVATFTDPGFTSSSAGTQESPFTATINWGDGSAPATGSVTVTQGSAGVLTSGKVNGTYTYTTAGDYTVTVTVTDDEGAVGTGKFVIHALGHGATQFFVVDQSAHSVFLYDAAGNLAGSWGVARNNQRGWGIATNAAADTLWIVDANKNVQVYVYKPDGTVLGNWQADTVQQPTDITTNGADIWMVDGGSNQVFRYANATSWLSGEYAATSSFSLNSANTAPTGMVTDGQTIWITDNKANTNKVFVYDLTGKFLGSWTLDPADIDPRGITLNPNAWAQNLTGSGWPVVGSDGGGGTSTAGAPPTDLWTVDQHTNTVYRYAGASIWRSGNRTASGTFALDPSDHHAEGIADPVTVQTPTPASTVPQGNPVLVSGSAQPSSGASLTSVTVNGTQALTDAGGNFFEQVIAGPGQNSITAVSADSANVTATQTLSVTGTAPVPAGQIDFSILSDVTRSISTTYGRTSFNNAASVLYANLTATNIDSFKIYTPFLVGVRHISAPSVRVFHPTGVMADGTPYFDLSSLVTAGVLAPGQATQTGLLTFLDPEGLTFTYDLVYLGRLNHPPRWTSVPVVSVSAGQIYRYQASAFDPDGDPLAFSVVSGPTALGFTDAGKGLAAWSTVAADVGTYAIRLRVSDGKGGSADQNYVLSVLSAGTGINYPPAFTSTPPVDAYVGVPYTYQPTVADVDYDSQTLSANPNSNPAGLSLTSNGSVNVSVSWTPAYTQLGLQTVTLVDTDGGGLTATQTYTVLVHQQPGNDPPYIISTAPTSVTLGATYTYPLHAIDADHDPLIYSITSGPPTSQPAMNIDPVMGNITWTPSATGAYPISVRVDDGRGGFDTQSFTINVVAIAALTGAIYGTKYNDLNGNGVRDATIPAATTFGPITMQQIGLSYGASGNSADAIAYYPPANALMVGYSINATAISIGPGGPQWSGLTSLYLLAANGTETPFATLTKEGQEDGFSMVIPQAGNPGGFIPGDVFLPQFVGPANTGAPSPTQIIRISNGGKTIQRAWATLGSQGFIQALALDTANVFGGALLALVTAPNASSSQVWTIDALGNANPLPGNVLLPFDSEPALQVVPNNAAQYGSTLAGKLLVTGDGSNAYTVAVVNGVTTVNTSLPASGLDDAANVAIVPAGGVANVFAAPDQQFSISVAAGAQFAPIWGQILAAHEGSGPVASPALEFIDRVWWDGSTLQSQQLTGAQGPTALQQPWERLAFIPAALGPVPNPLEPGLPNWTIYLDLNNNGTLDAGEPSTLTDANGNYSFTNLQPGNYIVREVPQAGWTQRAPAAGSYSATVVGGKAVSGEDFGNQQTSGGPTPDTPPTLTLPPNATAVVGALYSYNAVATDPDHDVLTFDAPVAPDGLAVDGPTGIVVWRPTLNEVGAHTVLLRVTDSHGSVDTKSFTITVLASDPPPTITSQPVTSGSTGKQYQYQVWAQDADNETLAYTVTQGPSGLAFIGTTGLLLWNNAAAGTYPVTVQVSDPHGSSTQTYTLTIGNGGAEQGPVITSLPPTQIGIGETYVYEVQANDPDGDALAYSFTTNPVITGTPPMWMDNNFLTWTPTAAQVGSYGVTVTVTDARGNSVSQPYTLNVGDQAGDLPPTITSDPPLVADVGQGYVYNAQGSDPYNYPLFWRLTTAPAGMSVNAVTGSIRWTPSADQVGIQNVTLRVADPLGASAFQSYTIAVRGGNLPPTITSTPVINAVAGQLYTYAVVASDPDGDPLSYAVSTNPSTAMTVTTAGVVTWTAPVTGTYTVTVTVSDGQGASAVQVYNLSVVSYINYPPVITSQPPRVALTTQSYSYTMVTADPDHDTQYYSVTSTPASGLAFSSNVLTWASPVVGTYQVVITDTDQGGLACQQIYTLTVAAPTPPSITSSAPLTVTAGLPYRYDVQVSDSDNGPYTYALSNAPSWLSIDQNGRIYGNTDKTLVGVYNNITVSVTDPMGSQATPQIFNLTVQADTTPPTVELQMSPNPITSGNQETFLVFASDNVGVTSLALTLTDANNNSFNVPLDAKGQAVVTLVTSPSYSVQAKAWDAAGNTGVANGTVTVNAAATNPPTVQITAPAPIAPATTAVVTSPVSVTGTIAAVTGATLNSYSVSIVPFDGSGSTVIATGSAPVNNATICQFDPTLLANGDYTLQITATSTFNSTSVVSSATTGIPVSVEGNLKLGRETLSVTDLTIPVAGIPITIMRTYDSLNAGKSMDFGYGWQLSYGDAQLKVDLVPGTGQTWGELPPFTDGTHVYVTMPGGQKEGFTFTPWHDVQLLGVIDYWHPAFTADPGVNDQLKVVDALMTKDGNQYFTIENSGLNTYNPADWAYGNQYTLTILNGTGYEIAADTGKLFGMTSRNGNSLAFSDTAITSNTGKVVTITRDPAGHITAIVDPRGNSVKYGYDASGNLVSVADRAGDPATAYTYDPSHAHYLSTVVDPLGVQQLKVTYDSTTNRMTQMLDAKLNPLNFGYNLSTLSETVTDPNLPAGSQTATVALWARQSAKYDRSHWCPILSHVQQPAGSRDGSAGLGNPGQAQSRQHHDELHNECRL